jgi:hypothetical protein
VFIVEHTSNTYTLEAVHCLSDDTLLANRFCIVPLSVLYAEPYSLVLREEIRVKIVASNFYGDSVASEVGSGAIIWVVPDAPINLFIDQAATNAEAIRFTWTEGPENGATPVLDYNVWWDNGTGSGVYTMLAEGVTTEYYQTTAELTPAVEYTFKVEARNAVGIGAQSLPITIRAARVPDAPVSLSDVPAIFAVDGEQTGGITNAYQIGLDWQDGAYNGGTPVIDYRVSYKQLASVDFIVYQSNITALPYTVLGLEPGITYTFKVEARNLVGFSAYSATVDILAAQVPDKPTGLADVPTITLATRIGLVWIAPEFNGGISIQDYRVWFDDGRGDNLYRTDAAAFADFLADDANFEILEGG